MTAEAEIKALAAKYEIPFLVHFTRAENLPSIMQMGLIPRSELEPNGVQCAVNDDLRLDGRQDSISLSIAFPNSRMLWALRQNNPGVKWVVLALSKSILWSHECAFCKHNAADKRMSGAPLGDLRKPAALEGLYGEIPGQKRSEQNLKPYDPTDVQAEILAFGVIDPNKIIGAAFQRPAVLQQYQNVMPDRKLVTHWDSGFFSDRAYNRKS